MFVINNTWGNHTIYTYDINKHPFIQYFKELYNENILETLQLNHKEYLESINDDTDVGILSGSDTELHSKFYSDIKNNDEFKQIYCAFIKDIYNYFFPNETFMIFQSYPSIRIQYCNGKTIPPHKDSDHLSNHPLGEKNFLIPITKMINTNSIFIESEPDKMDFQSINLNPGELFYFNGNTCTHYNEKNVENSIRISLDFRVMLYNDYIQYIKFADIKKTNPRDLQLNREPTLMLIGKYYQCFHKDSNITEMMNWNKLVPIMQHRPTFEKEEADEVYKYMSQDNFITEHTKTTELEKIICEHLNVKHCIMTTSGTTAIMLSLMALNLQENDEVIVPNYTMIATINSVKMLKLKPIIIDVDVETCTLNLDEIKKYVNENTKCILHVSLNNRYKDIHEIVNYCKENNLYLIEDAAQSLGCKINGKSLGTFGDMGCFSLSTPKIISTGQGGFVVSNNDDFANKIRMMKNFGRRESGIDDFVVFGINLKFTDLQAVIGIEQMKKLDGRVIRLREIYKLYYEELHDIVEIKKPMSEEWIPWFVDIYIEDRALLMEYLKKHKISTRPVYGEINKTPVYYEDNTLKNSHYICNNGLFLPSYITLKDEDIYFICKLIKMFYVSS
jgi:perosamine synthetase